MTVLAVKYFLLIYINKSAFNGLRHLGTLSVLPSVSSTDDAEGRPT